MSAMNEVTIPLPGVTLSGELDIPNDARGLVLFAHGSGSSRHSPRNQFVARTLRSGKIGTLLFDLLTVEEEQAEAYTRHFRFNIPFLAERLIQATRWVMDHTLGHVRTLGYFGSSTGAAAALVAAANLNEKIGAVVSRGGRPDLARDALQLVAAPTLLIVGGDDTAVLSLNEDAFSRLPGEKQLRIVPGASHLFEENGALEQAARMALEWFTGHLAPATHNPA